MSLETPFMALEVITEEDSYLKVLPQGQVETDRLNNQHRFFPENLSYLVHPLLHRLLSSPNLHIADIGTGTRIFLSSLLPTLPPTATLHGFDLSAAQFPPPASTPQNLSFSIADAKTGFPSAHQGRYDIVHLRLLSPGMQITSDWRAVAANALTLLKPGGAIQWCEESTTEKLVVFNEVPGGSPVLASLFHRAWDTITAHYHARQQCNPFSYFGSAVDLVSVLQDVGARDVRYEVVEFTRVPGLRALWTVNVVETMRGVLQSIALEGGDVGFVREEELKSMFDRMVLLAREGKCYIRSDIHVHIAFKAKASALRSRKPGFRARL